MSSRSLVRRAEPSALPRRGARGASVGAAVKGLPGSDALLLLAVAILALLVFQLAAWLATAPLSTLVFSLALVPLALFVTAIVAQRTLDPRTRLKMPRIERKP